MDALDQAHDVLLRADHQAQELEPSAVLAGFHETFRRLGLNTELTIQLAAQVFALAEVRLCPSSLAALAC